MSLDMLANPHDYRGNSKAQMVDLLSFAAVELRKHAEVAVHAAKGSAMIEPLLPLVNQDSSAVSHPPRTIHDLVQELSSSNQHVALGDGDLPYQDPIVAYMGVLEN